MNWKREKKEKNEKKKRKKKKGRKMVFDLVRREMNQLPLPSLGFALISEVSGSGNFTPQMEGQRKGTTSQPS